MIDRLLYWFRIQRHVNALAKADMIVLTVDEQVKHLAMVDGFFRWAITSGSLNDGTTPSHTRKRAAFFAREVLATFPMPHVHNVKGKVAPGA
jgi:hypothetical protein